MKPHPIAALALFVSLASAQDASPPEPPRLVVLLSVDQLAEWVYAQGRPFLAADGGFRRLEQRGVTFADCAYEHACSETGPGHATIGTGAPASVHGILKNQWWSPAEGQSIYCVGETVEALAAYPEGKDRGPARLLVPTFADTLKAHSAGSKVASVAWKDRSAILMAGGAADICAWFEKSTGNLVTNKRWVDEPPAWLQAFNEARAIDGWFGRKWERFGGEEAYAGLVDDRPYEWVHGNGANERVLPQPLTGGKGKAGPRYYSQICNSPFGNTMVRLAAEAALAGMELGKDDVCDLLCASFSATDYVGHYFGPDSVEARDTLLRLDRDLGLLFDVFDREVGEGRWAVFVTADHGVGPTPEQARQNGVAAGRGPIDAWVKSSVENALIKRFGQTVGKTYVARVSENTIYLDHTLLGDRIEEGRRVAAQAASRPRGVMVAYSRDDLRGQEHSTDAIRRALAHAVVPGRSGDVLFVVRPYWVNGTIPATHGSPHAYDREVVAFGYGPGMPAGTRIATPITPGFGVVLFARMLHVPTPSAATEHVPAGLLGLR